MNKKAEKLIMVCLDCGHKGDPIRFDGCPMCGGYMEDPNKENNFLDDEDDSGYDDGYGNDHEGNDDDWQIF